MKTVEYDMVTPDNETVPVEGMDVMEWLEDMYEFVGAARRGSKHQLQLSRDVVSAVVSDPEGPAGGNPVVDVTFRDEQGMRNFSRVWSALENSGNLNKVTDEEAEDEFNFAMERAYDSTPDDDGPSPKSEDGMISVEYDMLTPDDEDVPRAGANVMHWVDSLYKEMGAGIGAGNDVKSAVVVNPIGPGGGNPEVKLTFANFVGLKNFSRVWVAAQTSGDVNRVSDEDIQNEFDFASERAS